MEIDWYKKKRRKTTNCVHALCIVRYIRASNMEFYCVIQFNIVHMQRHIAYVISWDTRVRGLAKFASIV